MPKNQLSVADGSFDSVQSALAPKLGIAGSSGPVTWGVELDEIGPDVMGSPKSIWGQTSTNVGGFAVKSRAEYTAGKYDYASESGSGVYLTVEAEDADQGTFAWFSGQVPLGGGPPGPLKVGAKKIFVLGDGAKVMIEPRYGAEDGPDVCVGYESDAVGKAYLTVSGSDQNIKIMRDIDDSNSASVKVGRSGFISASLTNDSTMGTTSVNLQSSSMDLSLEKDGWMAGMSLSAPYLEAEPQVTFRKTFSLSTEV